MKQTVAVVSPTYEMGLDEHVIIVFYIRSIFNHHFLPLCLCPVELKSCFLYLL